MRVQREMVSVGLAVALSCSQLPGSGAMADERVDARPSEPAASAPSRSVTSGPQDMRSPAGASESGDVAPPRAPGVELIDEDKLRQRVQARWDAALQGDFAKAYAYEAPDIRKATSQQDYAFQLGRTQVRWHVASLKELRYDRPDRAIAVVTLEYSFPIAGGGELMRTSGDFPERWVFLDGEWWRQEPRRPPGGGTQAEPPLDQ